MLQLRILKGIPSWIIWTVKISIVAFAVRFILEKIFRNDSIDELTSALKSLQDDGSILLLIIAFLLLIANLFTETIKWRIIMKPLENIPMLKSFAAVLTGIAVSFFAPNRSGEFVGRILFIEHADKIKTSIVTILASIGQLVITISVGSICFIFYLKGTIESSWLYYPLAGTLLLLSIALIFLFIYFPYISERFSSVSLLKKFSEYISVMKLYKPKIFLFVISLSLIRYCIFVHQYFFLQKIFFPETPYAETLQIISIIYLALAIIPTFALSEIGVRSSVAMFYLASVISNPISIALATLSIWIINISLPSLAGCVLFLAVKFGNGKNHSTS